ncbi:thioesterase II family protein [Actinomadura flavalba]|uniref:thioesterase II family protein n=1 Tax=Actinomadura flavalba TaxID=1120938 RepID=UPI0003732EB4|nr:alpha/beta fold hydrolase [Actinomadura flavalba]
MPENGWLWRPDPNPAAALRLVCLPHGGGGASFFASWAALLPPSVELVAVRYPGREERAGEPPPASMDALADAVAAALAPLTARPYALFGHSMGATVAYEAAQRLAAPPVHLIASAREAPHDERGGDVHRRDDAGLHAELTRLGGTDPEVLRDPDLRALILRYVRADYRVIETYRPGPHPPLRCPVTTFIGDRDPDLTPAETLRWRHATTGRVEARVFPGDHFYLVPQRAAVLAALRRILTAATRADRAGRTGRR